VDCWLDSMSESDLWREVRLHVRVWPARAAFPTYIELNLM
jgi:hypothetical protein